MRRKKSYLKSALSVLILCTACSQEAEEKRVSVINVSGMVCRSCEVSLEKQLTLLKEVDSVHASSKDGTVTIYHSVFEDERDTFIKTISSLHYTVKEEEHNAR